jgi:hypothetical protein
MKRIAMVIVVSIVALVLIVVILSGIIAWKAWRLSKPITTVGRMRDLMSVLLAEQPNLLNKQTVTQALKKYGRDECYNDGWGRPFIIEPIEAVAGKAVYRVTSLGSDGARGPCCRGFVDSFEEDAVLEGDVWQQQWSFGHSPNGRRLDGR